MCLILIFPEKFRRGEKIAFPWGKVAAKRPDEGRWGLMVSASPLPPSDEGGGTEGAGGSVLP